ncbi:MAG TPA: hypothetical protein VIS10_11125 [Anaerolineales bacterium]
MIGASPFLILDKPCDHLVDWAVQKLTNAGLQVMPTFNLQAARLSHPDCPCPYHGTQACDCQMVVLLVYTDEPQPASLVIHMHHGRALFYLVDTPQQRAGEHLIALIQGALL